MVDVGKLGFAIDSSQVIAGKKALDAMARSAGKAERQTKKLKKETKKLSAASKGLNSQMLTLRATLVTLGTGVLMTKVINTHREFGKAISNLSAITGATGKDLIFLTQVIEEFGSTTTLTASQVAKAFKLVASAKPDLLANLPALKAVTRETITLAEAASIDVPLAAKVLGLSLNQFGLSANKARETINVLAAGAKFGSSEITQTAVAIQKSGVVANAAGISFLELNAAIQVLAKGGTTAEIAGTGLRGAILKLSTQVKSEFNPSIVGLATAFENLEKAGLTDIEMLKLFGQEGIVVGRSLMENTALLRQFEITLKDTNTAIEQASINVDNFDGDMLALGSAFEGVTIKIGKSFDPALREAAQSMTEVIRDFSVEYDKISVSTSKALVGLLAIDKVINKYVGTSALVPIKLDFFLNPKEAVGDLSSIFDQYKSQIAEIDLLASQAGESNGEKEAEITEKTFTESKKRIEIYADEVSNRKAISKKELKDQEDQIKKMKDGISTFNTEVIGMQTTVARQISGVLRISAGGNKDMLIAALAIEKGIAASRILINSAVARTAASAAFVGNDAGLATALGTIDGLQAASLSLVAASGVIQAKQISDSDGQRHGGDPFVAQTGSFTIKRGERILETKTNKDLTDFLKRAPKESTPIVVNVDASGTNDEEVIRRAAEAGAKQGYEMVADDLRRGGSLQRQVG